MELRKVHEMCLGAVRVGIARKKESYRQLCTMETKSIVKTQQRSNVCNSLCPRTQVCFAELKLEKGLA